MKEWMLLLNVLIDSVERLLPSWWQRSPAPKIAEAQIDLILFVPGNLHVEQMLKDEWFIFSDLVYNTNIFELDSSLLTTE